MTCTWSFAQNSNTAAGLAGVGAGAALGATAAGQGGTTPSAAGNGGNAPIEIQIMSFDGLQKVARDIAMLAKIHSCESDDSSCHPNPVLIQDTVAANEIALYQATQGYAQQMAQLYDELEPRLALSVTPSTLSFPEQAGAAYVRESVTITYTGSGSTSVTGMRRVGPNADDFTVRINGILVPNPDNFNCPTPLKRADSCVITVEFNAPAAGPNARKLTASLAIPNPSGSYQVVQLVGLVPAQRGNFEEFEQYFRSQLLGAQPAAGGAGEATTGGTTASTPPSLTYLSGITTALGGLKSSITYTSSSFQPNTQAFIDVMAAELHRNHIPSYSSTSPLNLAEATGALLGTFGQMLVISTDVGTWTNQCKLSNGSPSSNNGPQAGSPSTQAGVVNPECNNTGVVEGLAIAQQMLTGYTSLLQSANDGNGNPVILDILRGRVLWEKLADGYLSLQLTVSAAGGSTRSNNFFLLNLFYTPKPSYNAGVIVTFELRDSANNLLESGARGVLFDYVGYTSWEPRSFKAAHMKKRLGAPCSGSFCSIEDESSMPSSEDVSDDKE